MLNRLISILIVLMLVHIYLFSQVNAQQPGKKMALVIGNGNYTSSILANPENDARAMESVLKKLGFIVYKYENLNQTQMKKAIDDFGLRLKGCEVGLFYYAGHGIQSGGYNYLIPVDAQLMTERQVEYDCVRADRILALMEDSGTKVNIIILDACRNNPFERAWTRSSVGRGLAFMSAPTGTLIAYSTAPGNTAQDGSGYNSPYTAALLESIQIPGITITQMFQNVTAIVSQKTNKQQVPWISSSLTGDFYFNPAGGQDSYVQKKPEQVTAVVSGVSRVGESEDYFVDPVDGQRYRTVRIGNQVWMAENLKTTKLNDGTPIPLVTDNTAWRNLTTPGYCWYGNNSANKDTYGALYNWYTVNTGKLCPAGWHVPTDAEWTTMENYLIANGFNYDSTTTGNKIAKSLASTYGWASSSVTGAVGNTDYPSKRNATGFTALPGGRRSYDGAFNYVAFDGYWWSATELSAASAWYRYLYYDNSNVVRYFGRKKDGFSVRCVRD